MCRRFLIATALLAAGCGGSSSAPSAGQPPQQPRPVSTTETFSGTTVQSGPGACGGDSHNFTAQDGTITVNLVATSDPANALSVQVCPGGIDTGGNCTIAQQRISVGQTLSGVRRGVAQQNLKLLPFGCVFGGTPAGTPVTYTVGVTYLK
jgi:hypothetical protein